MPSESMLQKCTGRTQSGNRCSRNAIYGSRCKLHTEVTTTGQVKKQRNKRGDR